MVFRLFLRTPNIFIRDTLDPLPIERRADCNRDLSRVPSALWVGAGNVNAGELVRRTENREMAAAAVSLERKYLILSWKIWPVQC